MAQKLKTKNELLKDHQRHENDCGSSEVQIAFLTQRINNKLFVATCKKLKLKIKDQ